MHSILKHTPTRGLNIDRCQYARQRLMLLLGGRLRSRPRVSTSPKNVSTRVQRFCIGVLSAGVVISIVCHQINANEGSISLIKHLFVKIYHRCYQRSKRNDADDQRNRRYCCSRDNGIAGLGRILFVPMSKYLTACLSTRAVMPQRICDLEFVGDT